MVDRAKPPSRKGGENPKPPGGAESARTTTGGAETPRQPDGGGAKSGAKRKAIAATAAGVAGVAAAAAGVATVRAIRKRSAKTSKKGAAAPRVYHVLPEGEGWKVGLEGRDRPAGAFDTKKEAVAGGRELAQKNEPSRLVIHGADGTVQRAHSYGETEDA